MSAARSFAAAMSYTGRPSRVKGALRAGAGQRRAEPRQARPRLPWRRGHCPLRSQNGASGPSLRGRIPQASAPVASVGHPGLLAPPGVACVFCDPRPRASALGPSCHRPRLWLVPHGPPRPKTSLLRPELLRSVRCLSCCRRCLPRTVSVQNVADSSSLHSPLHLVQSWEKRQAPRGD